MLSSVLFALSQLVFIMVYFATVIAWSYLAWFSHCMVSSRNAVYQSTSPGDYFMVIFFSVAFVLLVSKQT